MRALELNPRAVDRVLLEVVKNPLFSAVDRDQLKQIVSLSKLIQIDPGEALVRRGEPSDAFYLVIQGVASVVETSTDGEGASSTNEIALLQASEIVGEMGVLLKQPRSATVLANDKVLALKFSTSLFDGLYRNNAGFLDATSRVLAQRLSDTLRTRIPSAPSPTVDALERLEVSKPVRSEGLNANLTLLLKRMAAMEASDLHLTAGQAPRVRAAGEIRVLDGEPVLGPDEVLELALPAMSERVREDFEHRKDTDFACALPGTGRFRVNLFHDAQGISAVFRRIPERVPLFKELGLPPILQRLAEQPSGLVVFTGPTGCGKSTTMASLIEHINQTRATHVITLEDPIEYMFESKQALINQREVGSSADSFSRGLRAALREDPDVLLVGELRDAETAELTLELANTGHLVFATMHSNTVTSAIDRIVALFPEGRHSQVYAVLADVLRGAVAQTLCRKIGGGRVAATECLLVNYAVANLVREGKTFQIPNVMATGKGQGNLQLNDSLAQLVVSRQVAYEEALSKSHARQDFARRFNRETGMAA